MLVKEDPKLVLLKWHEQSAHFRELMQHAGWEMFMDYAGKVVAEETERLHAVPPGLAGGVSDYQRGVIAGLRRAVGLPAEIVKNTEFVRGNRDGQRSN